MAPTTPNRLEQPRVGEEKINKAYVPSAPTSSNSAPTPTAQQYKGTTLRRSGMRTISASAFCVMGRPPAAPTNTPETDDDPFALLISSSNASRTQLITQDRPRLAFRDSQVEDMQAYVEDSDSDNGSTLGDFASPRSTSHDTMGSRKVESEEERNDDGKGKVGSEGENNRGR